MPKKIKKKKSKINPIKQRICKYFNFKKYKKRKNSASLKKML